MRIVSAVRDYKNHGEMLIRQRWRKRGARARAAEKTAQYWATLSPEQRSQIMRARRRKGLLNASQKAEGLDTPARPKKPAKGL